MIELRLGKVCLRDNLCRKVPLNPNARMHWAERHRWNRAWKDAVYYSWLELGKPKLAGEGKPTVSILFRQIHLMDKDNLHAAAKPLIDALKPAHGILDANPGIGLIPDDGPDDIVLEVIQEKAEKRDEEGITMTISQAGEQSDRTSGES